MTRLDDLLRENRNNEFESRVLYTLKYYQAIHPRHSYPNRTVPMLDKHGFVETLNRLMKKDSPSSGFLTIVNENGDLSKTFEQIVIDYPEKFSESVVDRAKLRLSNSSRYKTEDIEEVVDQKKNRNMDTIAEKEIAKEIEELREKLINKERNLLKLQESLVKKEKNLIYAEFRQKQIDASLTNKEKEILKKQKILSKKEQELKNRDKSLEKYLDGWDEF